MKNLYLSFLLFTATLSAQDFLWLQTPEANLSLNPELVGYCVATDPTGNVYSTGFKDNAYSYNDIFGDIAFTKYNNIGQVQFSKTFQGRITVYDMATDASGNVVMCVGYVNAAVFETIAFSTQMQGIQPLLIKFDPDGNVLWHYTPLIEDAIETNFRGLTVDASGNIYVGLDTFQHSYIRKVSPNGVAGNLITQLNTGMITSLDTDTEGNIYAAGSCADPNANFAGVTVSTTFFYNTWIVKYSPTGVYEWARFVDDITCSRPSVRVNTPDQVYFSSDLYGSYDFDGIQTEGPTQGLFNDVFISKLNASGVFQWVKEVPGSGTLEHGSRNFLAVDGSGHVNFVGKTRGTIVWDESYTTTAEGFSSDAIVLQFDTDGTLLLAKTAGGASEDRIDAVAVDDAEQIFIAGMARGDAMFGDFSHEAEGVTVYPYVAKIGSAVILGNDDEQLTQVKIWPNPASENIHLSGLQSEVKGEIINMLGQKVLSFETSNQTIDIKTLSSGIYLMRIEGFNTVKFIKS